MTDVIELLSHPPINSGLGAMMAGGNPADGRQEADWYPTPANVTQALLNVETFGPRILEPCCGDGALSKVLAKNGYCVYPSDVDPREESGMKYDLFDIDTLLSGFSVITNPPYQLSDGRDVSDIINHFFNLRPDKLALLLKSSYFHAVSRYELFTKTKPARLYPLTWRPDFLGKGRPTMEFMWVVWYRDYYGDTVYQPLRKPAAQEAIEVYQKAAVEAFGEFFIDNKDGNV